MSSGRQLAESTAAAVLKEDEKDQMVRVATDILPIAFKESDLLKFLLELPHQPQFKKKGHKKCLHIYKRRCKHIYLCACTDFNIIISKNGIVLIIHVLSMCV